MSSGQSDTLSGVFFGRNMSKKSFLIHIDSLDVIDDLTDEQCGELLRAFKAFHNGDDLELSQIVKIAFSPFKNQFNRDLEKYESICNRNKSNGLKGGRPKKENNPDNPVGLLDNPEKPKKADNDNKKDSDSDKDNKANNITSLSPKADPIPYQKIIDLYHELLPDLPRVAKLTPKRKGQIRQRFNEDMKALDNWENFFDHVKQSDFLMGRVQPINGRTVFRADIEWLTNQTNFTKIAEGKYHV